MDDYLTVANSIPMWIACGSAVILCLVQAYLFAIKSYSTGKKIGLSEQQMKSAMKSSFITAVGPSLVILTGLLSLLVSVGGPMAWMRLSFIGSVMFETMAAGFGAEAVGETLGAGMSTTAFATAVWTMILGSIGWIIFSTLTADKMDKVQAKFSGGNPATTRIISTAAILGSFGSLLSGHIIALNNRTLAALCGALIMVVLAPLSKNENLKWLREWALAFALLGGLIVAALAPQFSLKG